MDAEQLTLFPEYEELIPLTFDEYQKGADKTAIYPDLGDNLVYPALKLAGEAGEVAEKIGKLIRDKGYRQGNNLLNPGPQSILEDSEELHDLKDNLTKELGDVLWYLAALASELGVNLSYVAQKNLDKLNSRKERGVLGGSGDDR